MYTEPLWAIPFHLYMPFAPVYMLALGLTERTIGLIATVGLLLQIVTSTLGGPITDKLGRKRATFIFDVISWSIPTLLWAFAGNELWFYLAALFNSLFRITMTSWTCLLIEDAPPDRVVHFWTWVHVAGIAAGIVTPLAGLLIERFALIPTMRAIYLFAFVSMTAKFVILNVYATETRQGEIRMRETANMRFLAVVSESVGNVRAIFRSPGTVVAIVVLAVHAIYLTLYTTFFSVFLAEGLLFSPREIGIFPALRSVVILIFFFLIIPRLHQQRHIGYLAVGFGTTVLAMVVLVIAPVRGLWVVAIASFIEAAGAALLAPYIQGFITAIVDPYHRARVLAVAHTVVLTIASPFGWIGGVLSEAGKALPFVLAGILLTAALVFILILNPEREANTAESERPRR